MRALLPERPPCTGGADACRTEVWLTLAFSSWQGWQCQAKIENVALLASPHPSLPLCWPLPSVLQDISIPPFVPSCFLSSCPTLWHENLTDICIHQIHSFTSLKPTQTLSDHFHFQNCCTKPFLALCNLQYDFYWPLSANIQKCKLDKSITLLSPWATVAFSVSSEE